MKKLKLKLLAITVATTTMATIIPSIGASAAWKQNQGNWYYLNDSGEVKTGWVNDNGTWYYLDNSGVMKTGWVKDNSTWYYLNNSGAMKTGWVNESGTWYYLNNSGAMKKGWINDNGTWYFADTSGTMQTGVAKIDGKTYYLDETTGAMRVGDITINGTTHTFAQSGEAIGSDLVPTKTFNSNGVKVAETSTQGNSDKTSDNNKSNTTTTSEQSNSTSTTSSGKSHHSSSSNSSSGSSSTQVNKEALINAITTTKAKYEAAVEGTENGQYKVGSKATFKIAIDAAQAVADNTGSAQKDIDSAVTALASATTIFDNSINKDVNPSVSTNYLENYREQYHYSPAKAWANDPNGMVYFNGEYHLFYQYYPEKNEWGPMHWGHAVSTDLIHWKELGIAIAPDGDLPETGELKDVDRYEKAWDNYGKNWIYSGSAVIDKDNTSGFFDGIAGGGLVAIYTQHSENPFTEQQAIAYSKDNGRTWIKPEISEAGNNIVISKEDDPLNRKDFRDPKIIYLEDSNEWLMVVAGGPLRFFSSKDLKTWKPEAMQSEINTECPDIYKLEVGNTGTYKWVLSEGGRYYRVGDLKKVDDKWTFVPDEEYKDEHLPMNFAKDAYAAQTYYGTGENGTPDGRRIMINWMNNWDYCNNVAPITKTFNGSFDLQTELKLVTTDAGVRLIQQPIDEYKTLRKSSTTFDNVTISPDQPNIMSNLSGSKYEIVAEFTPDEKTTEVGFKLRVGKDADQETIVKYNIATGELVLDRSKSGKSPSANKFLEAYSQKMSKTSDGKIQLHIFVDAASVEVYGNNGEVTGSAQIFPNRSSDGVEVYSVGGNSTATIQYYPISSIWNNESDSKDSVLVSLSEGDLGKTIGNDFTIYTSTVPETAEQGVTWTFDSNVLEIVNQDDEKTTFKTKGVGNTNLTATSKDQKSSKTINVSVYDSNPSSIIKDLTNFETTGDWYVKDNSYTGSNSSDGFAVAQETNVSGKVSSLKADADVSDGSTAGLVLLSKSANPKEGSIIANINKNGEYRVFVFTGLDANGNPQVSDLNSGIVPKTDDSIYKLKAEVSDGHVKYWINNELVCDTKQSYYETGRFGLNVYGGATSFKNVNLSNDVPSTETSISGSGLTFANTPKDLHVSDDSYVVDGGKNNNGFAISDQEIDTSQKAYILDVDSKMLGDWHNQNPANGDVAGVVLFAQGDNYFGDGGIIANVGKWGHYRLFGQVPDGNGGMKEVVFAEGDVPEAQYNRYRLKVELNGNHVIYWINNKKVCDITQDYYTTGKFGLNVWNGASEFRNITLTSDAAVNVTTGAAVTATAPVKEEAQVSKVADTTGGNVTVTTGAAVTATTPVKEEAQVSKVADTIEGDITVTTGAAVTVAAPVTGEVPVSKIAGTKEYTATITWSETPVIFESKKVYTAKITIIPKTGYTLMGVPKDFFTVEGATSVTNDADSGVITAVFPATN